MNLHEIAELLSSMATVITAVALLKSHTPKARRKAAPRRKKTASR